MTLASLRERWPVWLAGLGVLLLAAPIAYVWRSDRPASAPTPEPRVVQVTRTSSLDLYPSLSPDGASVAYASARDAGFELFVVGPGGSERALTADGQHNVQPAWSPDGRTIVFHSRGRGGLWTVPSAGGTPQRLTSYGSRPAWSPDGATIAFQSESQIDASWTAVVPLAPSAVHVVAASGGEPRPVTRTGSPAGGHGNPAWTPGGELVFVAYDRVHAGLWRVKPDGTALERLNVPPDQPMVSDPASCAACDAIYYVSSSEQGSSGIWKLRLAPGSAPEWVRAQVVGQGLERFRHLSLSRDGRRLAYSAVSALAELASVAVDPATGNVRSAPRLITSTTGRSSRPVFSPDGARIAYTHVAPGARSDVWVADADGAHAYALTSDAATDTFPSWVPDGTRVVFLSDRGGESALWSADVTTKRAELVRRLAEPFDAPRLSPDGRWVAFNWAPGGKGLNAWLMPLSDGPPTQVTTDAELLSFPAWAPDGRSLALQRKDGGNAHVAVVPLGTAATPRRSGPPRMITTEAGLDWPHSWSPDGDKVAFAALRGGGTWNVRWVSIATGEQRELTSYRTPRTYVRYPAWSPRGDAIVFEYAETRGNVWTAQLD